MLLHHVDGLRLADDGLAVVVVRVRSGQGFVIWARAANVDNGGFIYIIPTTKG